MRPSASVLRNHFKWLGFLLQMIISQSFSSLVSFKELFHSFLYVTVSQLFLYGATLKTTDVMNAPCLGTAIIVRFQYFADLVQNYSQIEGNLKNDSFLR